MCDYICILPLPGIELYYIAQEITNHLCVSNNFIIELLYVGK